MTEPKSAKINPFTSALWWVAAVAFALALLISFTGTYMKEIYAGSLFGVAGLVAVVAIAVHAIEWDRKNG